MASRGEGVTAFLIALTNLRGSGGSELLSVGNRTFAQILEGREPP